MVYAREKKTSIAVDAERCQGCLICVMRCSMRFDKSFNPETSRIRVIIHFDRSPEIHFTEECDKCGICAKHCPSGTLILGEKIAV
ncbi:MAG: 4Fe-4S binding protein [Deltaproteobacteria bacterium]|nr:4Fe-4S binding protein [Deltaproteobacteria bacterium]